MNLANEWQIYRTRFLIQAKQLTEPLYFVDALGREHHGQKGDYLVESSDGLRRIAPREIFEDVYVPMGPVAAHPATLPVRKIRQPSSNPHLPHRPESCGPGGLARQF
jgi:hypothetical protein